jgi:hypothetical protein
MDDEIADIVRQHGWFAASIYDNKPPFLYSIGLIQTCDHPELIVFGWESKTAHALCSAIIRDIRGGKSFAARGVFAVAVGDSELRIGIRRVHPTQHPLYLGFAMGFCRRVRKSLEAVQVFWPDEKGLFPFDVGCNAEVFDIQPRLDFALSPSEIRRFKRQCE